MQILGLTVAFMLVPIWIPILVELGGSVADLLAVTRDSARHEAG